MAYEIEAVGEVLSELSIKGTGKFCSLIASINGSDAVVLVGSASADEVVSGACSLLLHGKEILLHGKEMVRFRPLFFLRM